MEKGYKIMSGFFCWCLFDNSFNFKLIIWFYMMLVLVRNDNVWCDLK